MVILADSGSTKCDWLILDKAGKIYIETSTIGFNPYFQNEQVVQTAIVGNRELLDVAGKISYIFFYGAGSSSPEMCEIIKRGLQTVFTDAKITVDHDLLGSAMATYDGKPCISCILGTGSNSCYFDGKTIHQEVPSLAYILGDEGSGSYFGKRLLREYFYKKLPADLKEAFEREFKPTKEEVLRKVYREPNPNKYLASFMLFISKHGNHPHVRSWIVAGIRDFIGIHVKSFSNWQQVPVHFVGSIGHVFSDCLREACKIEGIRLGRVIQKPIDGLAQYHIRYRWPYGNH